jgi:hypothetical protein
MSDFFTSFDDSKRALAKLMARENITVQIVDNIPTANFNPTTRILQIPNWPTLTPDQLDLLIGHEVGHALWSDISYIETIVAAKKAAKAAKQKASASGLMTYFNVIEDTRIERKMRNAFPGLRRSFFQGYQQFMKTGPLFEMNSKGDFVHPTTRQAMPIAKMRLIDRINIEYKLGAFVQVPFSAEEREWFKRIDACTSMQDAFKVAEALYREAKEKEQNQKDQQGDQGQPKRQKGPKPPKGTKPEKTDQEMSDNDDDADSMDGEGDESDDRDGEADDSENDGESDDVDDDADESTDDCHGDLKGKPSSSESDPYAEAEEPKSVTDEANREGLQSAADKAKEQDPSQKIVHLLIKPLTDKIVAARSTSAKVWAEECNQIIDAECATAPNLAIFLKKAEQDWNDSFLATSKYMAMEFGRRKQAKNLSKIKIAKTGKINCGKLHAYKFSDDLFLRSMTVPNGQSHGIVMIIDASGSMQSVFGDVLDQVLLFANFAKAAQIPFECYLFTTAGKLGYRDYDYNSTPRECPSMGPQTLTLPIAGRLVGLINTMEGNFKRQLRALHTYRLRYVTSRSRRASWTQTDPTEYAAQSLSGKLPYSQLSSTPLYAGLMIGERHIERMKRTLKLDKVMNIVITDGGDCEGLYYETTQVDSYTGATSVRYQNANEHAMVVRDTVTKKNHVLVDEYKDTWNNRTQLYAPQNGLMQMLLDIIKERHNARTILIYLASGGAKRSASDVMGTMYYLTKAACYARSTQLSQEVTRLVTEEKITKGFVEDGQFVIPSKLGVADLVLAIPATTTRLADKDFEELVTDGMTQRKIAAAFVKSVSTAKTNRVFVNAVIPFII